MSNNYPHITPEALSLRLQSDSHVTLLDARSPAGYRSGHIPDACLAPLDELQSQDLSELRDGEWHARARRKGNR